MRETEILDILKEIRDLFEQYQGKDSISSSRQWEEEFEKACTAKSVNWKEQILIGILGSYRAEYTKEHYGLGPKFFELRSHLRELVIEEPEWLKGQDHTPVKF